MKYQITAVLVTYHPEMAVLQLIVDKLRSQGCSICVVNNSSWNLDLDGRDIQVIELLENKGIAHAQNRGMDWAFNENGSDFVLQMDQDSIPSDNLVETLVRSWDELLKIQLSVGLIGSQDIDKDTLEATRAKVNRGIAIPETPYLRVSEVLSSGSLIPKTTFDQVGGTDSKLFIDLVDFEYCWRIKANGLLVVKNPKALIFHKLGEGKVKILGLLFVGLPKPFRHYYSVRNTVYLILYGNAPVYWKVTNSFKIIFKLLVYPISLPQGIQRLSFIWQGLKDGISQRFKIINA